MSIICHLHINYMSTMCHLHVNYIQVFFFCALNTIFDETSHDKVLFNEFQCDWANVLTILKWDKASIASLSLTSTLIVTAFIVIYT
jgi:hypothetical protein